MKKLISAAASLAMAASMVGSAVPFATGAADASKSLEIRAFEDTAGKAVSTTITADQIAAGDVTIPFGIYLVEGTNDCDSLTCQWSVNSKDGDASTAYVSFESHEAGTEYYTDKRDVTLADGSTGNSNTLVGFAGTMVQNTRKGDYFSATGDAQYFSQAGYKSGNIANAWGSATWITAKDGSGYKWSGAKSDSYPIYVQDAVFKKGTPPGTYTIDFADYVPEAEYPDNMSNMIESNGKMTTKNGKLNLKSLTITIEGAGQQQTTTTTASTTSTPKTTTTTTASVTDAPQTTKPVNPNAKEDFIVTPAEVKAKPGETVDVECYVSAGSHKVGQYVVRLDKEDLPQGITYTVEDPLCYAVDAKGNFEYELLGDTYYCSTLSSGDPTPVNEKEPVIIFTFKIPETATPGEYDWNISRFHVVEDGFNKLEFDATIKPGKIVIEGDGTTTTTATTTATTTTTTTTATTTTTSTATTSEDGTTTTTTTTVKPGDALYGDVNCDKRVNIADVVVLNKWLHDSSAYKITDQGKINANCCDKDTTEIDSNDSLAIIQSIVHLVKELPCANSALQK